MKRCPDMQRCKGRYGGRLGIMQIVSSSGHDISTRDEISQVGETSCHKPHRYQPTSNFPLFQAQSV